MIINSGNPVVSGPEGGKLDSAFEDLELLIAIDQFQRESHRHAHWLIPGDHFLERSEINPLIQSLSPAPRAQFNRAAVSLPKGMRYEWEFLRDLTLAMDKPILEGKRWLNPVVKASIAVSKLTGNKDHGLSPAWLSRMLIRSAGKYRWKDITNAEHGLGTLEPRPEFGSLFGKLTTPSGKVQLAPAELIQSLQQLINTPHIKDTKYPLQLISRRRLKMMNSWSVETSMEGMSEKEKTGDRIELNQQDAERFALSDGQRVSVESDVGELQARVTVSNKVRPGVAVMEHGWGYRTFNPATGESTSHGGVNRNLLVSNRDVDALSRVPRLNGTGIRVKAIAISTDGP